MCYRPLRCLQPLLLVHRIQSPKRQAPRPGPPVNRAPLRLRPHAEGNSKDSGQHPAIQLCYVLVRSQTCHHSIVTHDYTSTACLHESEDPALHNSCRQTCKFCGARCACKNHARGEVPTPASWVDQARSTARELLAYITLSRGGTPELMRKIETDPNLFWLRGEEKPPGTRP